MKIYLKTALLLSYMHINSFGDPNIYVPNKFSHYWGISTLKFENKMNN